MSQPLLLDEMFSDTIAQQLRTGGYDVISVVAHPALVALPDDQILTHATAVPSGPSQDIPHCQLGQQKSPDEL